MRLFRRKPKRPEFVTVHLVEWPSGLEQGIYYVPIDRDSAIYAYAPGGRYYIDAARKLSIIKGKVAS